MSQDDTPPPAKLKSHGRLTISASLQPRDLMAEPLIRGAWAAHVVTLFPDAFPGILGLSLIGRALAEGLWSLRTTDLRGFGIGRHRNVDDTPAGGGAGMVIRPDVMDAALREAAGGYAFEGSDAAEALLALLAGAGTRAAAY